MKTKICWRCKAEKPEADFPVWGHNGRRRSLCFSCGGKEGEDRFRTEYTSALKNGKLVKPKRCSRCNKQKGKKIVGHHESYEPGRALDVIWVCTKCHALIHGKERREKNKRFNLMKPYFLQKFLTVW